MVKPQVSLFYTLWMIITFFSNISQGSGKMMKSAIYHSPEFTMQPGSVVNRFYYNIDFPKNHIGIKSFNAEVVDETGEAVPLHETYLHHWVVMRYYQRIGTQDNRLNQSNFIRAGNSGLCNNLGQYFGLGSETRRTNTNVPDPYAIEVGYPDEIPKGFEERWMLNVHAIDTRSVVDKLGCTECKCSLYNVSIDEYGRRLSPDYEGGLYCCYDNTQCKVKVGLENSPRRLYLRYTVNWFDWVGSLIPVRIYIFDITDTLKLSDDSENAKHQCLIEYEVDSCKALVKSNDECIDNRRLSFRLPRGGYVVYGVAHQHSGGIGSALYRKDGDVICASIPTYGSGNEAGNEKGYIVGMSSCYPKPGSLTIDDGETLVLESNYSSSSRKHTGVMGLFYIHVADELPKEASFLDAVWSRVDDQQLPITAWILLIFGMVAVAITVMSFRRSNQVEDGYEPVSM